MAQWQCPKCREFVNTVLDRNLGVLVKDHTCPKAKNYEVHADNLSNYDRNFLNELLVRW